VAGAFTFNRNAIHSHSQHVLAAEVVNAGTTDASRTSRRSWLRIFQKAEKAGDTACMVRAQSAMDDLDAREFAVGGKAKTAQPQIKIVFDNPFAPDGPAADLDEILSSSCKNAGNFEKMLEALLAQIAHRSVLSDAKKAAILNFLEAWDLAEEVNANEVAGKVSDLATRQK
jgi:hypothetical protein